MARVIVRYEDACRLCRTPIVLEVERFPHFDKRGVIAPVDITEDWWVFQATGERGCRTLRGPICGDCIDKLADRGDLETTEDSEHG